jgi:hypothetical protein
MNIPGIQPEVLPQVEMMMMTDTMVGGIRVNHGMVFPQEPRHRRTSQQL